jgi:hypothetical protein
MSKIKVDSILDKLYNSNDPLCFEAAVELEANRIKIKLLESKIEDISLAAKYMLESLIEINKLSRERDRTPSIVSSEQLRLRLRECGNIAVDTIDLKSVKKAYERMYDE